MPRCLCSRDNYVDGLFIGMTLLESALLQMVYPSRSSQRETENKPLTFRIYPTLIIMR
nr:hypothetical protein Q903MT_gene6342 [Picea sitchensis]